MAEQIQRKDTMKSVRREASLGTDPMLHPQRFDQFMKALLTWKMRSVQEDCTPEEIEAQQLKTYTKFSDILKLASSDWNIPMQETSYLREIFLGTDRATGHVLQRMIAALYLSSKYHGAIHILTMILPFELQDDYQKVFDAATCKDGRPIPIRPCPGEYIPSYVSTGKTSKAVSTKNTPVIIVGPAGLSFKVQHYVRKSDGTNAMWLLPYALVPKKMRMDSKESYCNMLAEASPMYTSETHGEVTWKQVPWYKLGMSDDDIAEGVEYAKNKDEEPTIELGESRKAFRIRRKNETVSAGETGEEKPFPKMGTGTVDPAVYDDAYEPDDQIPVPPPIPPLRTPPPKAGPTAGIIGRAVAKAAENLDNIPRRLTVGDYETELTTFVGMVVQEMTRLTDRIEDVNLGLHVAQVANTLVSLCVRAFYYNEDITDHKLGYFLEITSLTMGIAGVINCVVGKKFKTALAIEAITERLISVFKPADVKCASNAGEVAASTAVMKVFGFIIAGGFAIASKKKDPLETLAKVTSTATQLGSTADILTKYAAEWLGLDLDGKQELTELVNSHIDKLQVVLDTPNQLLVGQAYHDAQALLKTSREMINSTMDQISQVVKNKFTTVLTETTKKLSDLKKQRDLAQTRPVPVCIHLWSAQGGLGKTDASPFIAAQIAKLYPGDIQKHMYMPNLNSKHWTAYSGEKFLHIDELGCEKTPETNPYAQLNVLLSSQCMAAPGAALEEKSQVLRPLVVIITSQRSIATHSTGLSSDSFDALKTRIIEYEVTDPAFNVNLGRQNQPHRRPDFSHLGFVSAGHTYTIRDVISTVTKVMKTSVERFTASKAYNENAPPLLNNAPLIDFTAMHNALGNDNNPHVTYMFGQTGAGKTTQFLRYWEEAADLHCMAVQKYGTTDVSRIVANRVVSSQPTLYVFDDSYSFMETTDQTTFLEFLNLLSRDDKVLVISNIAPPSNALLQTARSFVPQFMRGLLAGPHGCTPVKNMQPGLGRRIGLQNTKDGLCLYTDGTTLNYWLTGSLFKLDDISSIWASHNFKVNEVRMLESLPTVIPFKAGEADLWLSVPVGFQPHEVVAHITASMPSLRLATWLAPLKNQVNPNEDPVALIMVTLRRAVQKHNDLKVFVSWEHGTFYLNGYELFIGKRTSTMTYAAGHVYFMGGETFALKQETVDQVYAGRKPVTGQDVRVHLLLTRERDAGTTVWEKVLEDYPPSYLVVLERIKSVAHSKLTALLDWAEKHPMLKWVFAAATVAAGLFITLKFLTPGDDEIAENTIKIKTYTSYPTEEEILNHGPKKNRQKNVRKDKNGIPYHSDVCDCKERLQGAIQGYDCGCNVIGGRLVEHPSCPNVSKPLEMCKGGKGVSRGYRFGNSFYVYDNEQETYHNGAVHRAREVAREYGQHHDGIMVPHTIGSVKYRVGFERDDKGRKRLCVDLDDEFEGKITPSQFGNPFAANMISAHNTPSTGNSTSLYGLLYNSFVCRTPAHIFDSQIVDNAVISFVYDKKTYGGDLITLDFNRDVAFFFITKEIGSREVVSIQNVPDITDHLATELELSVVTACTLYDSADASVSMNNAMKVSEITDWADIANSLGYAGRFGIAQWATMKPPFCKPGHCGALACAPRPGKGARKMILGMFTASSPANWLCTYSISTLEEWIVVRTKIKAVYCTMASDTTTLVKANYLRDPTIEDHVEVYTFAPIADNIDRMANIPEDRRNIQSKSFKTFAHFPSHSTIDSRGKKTQVLGGAMTGLFGSLKKPAPTALEIIAEFPDKIPPDDEGRLRAENVRLATGLENYSDGTHPADGYKDLLTEVASQLGEYWSERTDADDYAPLSIEDAIWGTHDIDGLHRNTSTGAAYQTMYPGVTEKGHIWGAERNTWIGQAGREFKDACDKQFQAWKRGEQVLLPISFSLKSETLANEKLHKKRIFNIVDPITNVNLARIFKPIQRLFTKIGAKSPFQLALDPLIHMHEMYKDLIDLEGEIRLYESDVSSFDLTLPRAVTKACVMFFVRLIGAGPVLATMLRSTESCIATAPALVDESLMTRQAGMSSGVVATSLLDSTTRLVMFIAAWAFERAKRGLPWTVSMFYKKNNTKGIGDDLIIASTEEEEDFCMAHAAQFSREKLHVKETSVNDKDSDDFSPRAPGTLTFAGRSISQLPGFQGFWTGRLRESALSAIFQWTNTLDGYIVETTLKGQAGEVALHGERKYAEYVRLLSEHYNMAGFPTWKETCADIQQGILASLNGTLKENIRSDIFLDFTSDKIYKVDKIQLSDLKRKSTAEDNQSDDDIMAMNCKTLLRHAKLYISSYPDTWQDAGDIYRALASKCPLGALTVQKGGPYQPVPSAEGPEELLMLWTHMRGPEEVAWVREYADFAKFVTPVTAHHIRRRVKLAKAAHERNYSEFSKILSGNSTVLCSSVDPTRQAPQRSPAPASSPHASNTQAGSDMPMAHEATSATPVNTAPTIGGIGVDTLPAVAVGTPMPLQTVDGTTTSTLITANSGGVDELASAQTGVDFNLLELASRPLFNRLINLNPGISVNTILAEIEIDPWNPAIHNPHSKLWSDSHIRFVGSLRVRIKLLTASTFIAEIVAAVVPKVVDDRWRKMGYKPTLTDLEAFNPVHITGNVNGDANLEIKPTVGTTQLTGIYREQGQVFGTLYVIAGNNFANAFSTNEGIQLLIETYIPVESKYTLPVTLFPRSAETTIDVRELDVKFHSNLDTLVTDGIYAETINYSVQTSASPAKVDVLAPVPGFVSVLPKFYENTYFYFSGEELFNAQVEPGWAVDAVTGGFVSPQIVGATWTGQNITDPAAVAIIRRAESQSPQIVLENLTIGDKVPVKRELGYFDDADQTITTGPVTTQDIGDVALLWPDTVLVAGSEYVTNNGFIMLTKTGVAFKTPAKNPKVFYPTLKASNLIPVSGVPIATRDVKAGNRVPAKLYTAKFTDADSFVPSVAIGLTGHTIVPSKVHVTSMVSANKFLDANTSIASVITTFTAENGQVVAQVLRNRDGMFAGENVGQFPHSRYTSEFSILTQRHETFSVAYPSLKAPADAGIKNRAVTQRTVTGMSTQGTHTDFLTMHTFERHSAGEFSRRDTTAKKCGQILGAGISAASSAAAASRTADATKKVAENQAKASLLSTRIGAANSAAVIGMQNRFYAKDPTARFNAAVAAEAGTAEKGAASQGGGSGSGIASAAGSALIKGIGTYISASLAAGATESASGTMLTTAKSIAQIRDQVYGVQQASLQRQMDARLLRGNAAYGKRY